MTGPSEESSKGFPGMETGVPSSVGKLLVGSRGKVGNHLPTGPFFRDEPGKE